MNAASRFGTTASRRPRGRSSLRRRKCSGRLWATPTRSAGCASATLTIQLKRLEEDLGGPLLIRAGRGRKLELTALGQEAVRAVESWAHTLADQPRQTWHRATGHRLRKKGRKARPRPVDAPGVDGFPLLLRPAVRTFPGCRRLLRFLQAVAYPTLAAYCRDAGISPSTLTPQIQQLERDLQGQLLVRGQHGHRMRLTDFGEKVVTVALPCVEQLVVHEGEGRKDEDCETRSATSVIRSREAGGADRTVWSNEPPAACGEAAQFRRGGDR
ncbi:LysR family transcriptional regulator [Streptomyces sp. ActVer]|uniref:helix-turn-helix domain-containing protein n=1 Tax=Streptomyces sp. ActVer TaxID=3014558 RepID=UPI0034DD3D56